MLGVTEKQEFFEENYYDNADYCAIEEIKVHFFQ